VEHRVGRGRHDAKSNVREEVMAAAVPRQPREEGDEAVEVDRVERNPIHHADDDRGRHPQPAYERVEHERVEDRERHQNEQRRHGQIGVVSARRRKDGRTEEHRREHPQGQPRLSAQGR
jgi:hypothetical protein